MNFTEKLNDILDGFGVPTDMLVDIVSAHNLDKAKAVSEVIREAINKDRRRSYNQIMLKTDRKFSAPHPQSPMEFTRDAEVFNAVTAKWEKVVGKVLAELEASRSTPTQEAK